MDFLQQFALREDVTSLVQNAMRQRSVQGVTIQLDRYWSNAWLLEQTIGKKKMERRIRATWDDWFHWGPYRAASSSPFISDDEDELGTIFFPPTVSQFEKWEPPFWKEYMHFLGEDGLRAPVRIKILLYPPSGNEQIVIPELGPSPQLMVEFQSREPGILFSDPKRSYRPVIGGVSVGIGSADYGTLGGILRDDNGKCYALTCAHVAAQNVDVDQPARIDSSSTTSIGKRIRASSLKTCTATTSAPCACWSGGKPVNEVDAALIELDSAISSKMEVLDIGQISGIRTNFMPPLAVEINGRTSSNRHLRVGALVLAIRLGDHNKNSFCFTNLFEIKWPSFSRLVFGRPIQNGDSGAWVCASAANGFDFLGMVVGGNRNMGYANLSRSIQDWWSKNEKLSLSVV